MYNTVLITGASRGIGRRTAVVLAQAGYNIAVNCRTESDKAAELVRELTAIGADAHAFVADVSDSNAVYNMYNEIVRRFGGLYALVNNAGIAEQSLFTDITDAMWEKMIGTNLTGAFNCSRAVLPAMIRAKRGRIVNISSVWGQTGASAEVHYSAAKAGLIGLTKALAKETAPSGITVNCVCPGVIRTDMLSPFSAEDLDALANEIPANRLGTPDDVARATEFFLSEGAQYVTGQILGVNGGLE